MPAHPPYSILLRDVTHGDLPTFFEHQLDQEASAMAGFPTWEKGTFMAHWRQIMQNDSNLLRTILLNNEIAGSIASFEVSGEREVGCWLGRPYWAKGIATKALSLFLGEDRTRPLYAHVAKHNGASRRVLEKCGFTISGEGKYSVAGSKAVEEFILTLR